MHPTTEGKSGTGRRMSNWPAFGVLLIGAGLGALGVIPYELSVVPQTVRVPVALIVAAGVIQALVLAAIACAVGLWLGERVGLGAPLLRALLAGDPAAPRTLRARLPGTIGRGLAVGGGLAARGVALQPLLPRAAGAAAGAARPGAWQGLPATLYGGIPEEILFRFGVMTLLVWLGSRLLRQERPGAGLIWAANIGAALLFGGGTCRWRSRSTAPVCPSP